MTYKKTVETIRGLLEAENAKYEYSMRECEGVDAYRRFARVVSDVVATTKEASRT